ncbi:hypothetical protein DFH05DRAFT_1394856 [Lentinula detonsa]|uniref:Tail specific protease domain-containing protein n=1 Tax=Lentinula detonsa TaxID=2804962 RepID=A0A9W8P4M8_9AGAR|nr:hypothetical protein DFH05DRAFT_1394856 [Lentinula detonsa]
MITTIVLFSVVVFVALASIAIPDPCATIGGQKWVSPQDLRACYTSFAVDPSIKENIVDVINKTLAFHTSVNYEIAAPEPFTEFVHEDLLKDLARISSQSYPSDYDLHLDVSRTLKRLNDGHCVWINSCYVPLFLNFLPIPLVLLTDSDGTQSVHIAPEAFAVTSAEFLDEIDVWQEALPPAIPLQTVSSSVYTSFDYSNFLQLDGAQVTHHCVNCVSSERSKCKYARTLGTRLGGRATSESGMVLSITLTRSLVKVFKIGGCCWNFMTVSLRGAAETVVSLRSTPLVPRIGRQFLARYDAESVKLTVAGLILARHRRILAFYRHGMLQGLINLKSLGATQLIVDVSNNGGGFICAAEFLHRIIIGPKNTTVPQAGLDTETRDGPLARLIVQQIIQNDLDPSQALLYNPLNWNNASNVAFAADNDWLLPPVDLTINGHADAFSQRLGQECQPNGFTIMPPDEGLFPASNVVIVSNGRCASSCSLFSITMVKEEGVKTVVLGGRSDVQQAYCGTVGGQSTVFSEIDTETAKLKNNSLAPPDMMVNGVQGITWRLGFGIQDPTQPEEWQPHLATLNLLLTPDLVNNPVAIWTNITEQLLTGRS